MGSTNIPDRIDADAQIDMDVSAERLEIQIDRSNEFFILIMNMSLS